MAKNWTSEQTDAISARGGALLVSAAAGSGKTAVLVERVLRRICDENNPTELDRLLIVTYTKAAAAEMRRRIGAAIAERLSNDPHNPFLLRQQALLPRANISTIDSFCGNLVREYFYMLNISGDFRIADASELSLIKADALADTLDRFYSSESPDFYRLAEAFSTSKSDSSLENLILRIHEFLCSHPFGEKWIDKMLRNYDGHENISESVWGKTVLNYTEGALKYLLNLCGKSASLAQSDQTLAQALGDYLNIYTAMLTRALRETTTNSNWDKTRSAVLAFNPPRFPNIRGYKDNPVKLIIQENQKSINESMKKIAALFAFDSNEAGEQLLTLRPVIAQMFACVKDFTREFERIKRRKNLADFSDLEHWALSLLVDETQDGYKLSELSAQIASRFDEVMVDEYQDANEVQDAIFRALSGDNRRLFIVGDVKQSIYSFRQAMPEIFLERRSRCARYNAEAPVFPAAVILDKNFRSRNEITETVNFIFSRLMSYEVCGMSYTQEEFLKTGAVYPEAKEPCIDFMLIDADKCASADSNTAEACAIAEKILKMKKDGTTVTKNGASSRVEFGDIAILMRSPNKNAPVFAAVLKAYGIPVSCEKTENFFETYEVRALLNLLRIISNPLQDIPLLSVLMGPLYGFSSDDIANIRISSPKSTLYAAVMKASEQPELGCCGAARDFLNQLAELRAYSVTVSIGELISYIFDVTGFCSILNAAQNDRRVDSNLNIFCEYAAAYEKTGRRGLSAFLNHMDRLSENEYPLVAAADTSAADSNTVKIMSIHKSKGLEFPICILANTAKKFNMTDLRQKVLIHSRLGVAAKIRDAELSCYLPSLPHRALALELKRGICSEELRILYVALTRAREKLIFTASVKNAEKEIAKAASMIIDSQIPAFNVQSSDSYCSWLLMCALLHPDAGEWRRIARLEDYNGGQSKAPHWNFEIIESISDTKPKSDGEYIPSIDKSPNANGDVLQTLRRYADFSYPLAAIGNLPVKVSASEIAHREIQDLFTPALTVPSFLKEQKSTAAQKGSAVHRFLQICDFKSAKDNMENELQRLFSEGRLNAEEVAAVREKNPRFFSSELAREAMDSTEVFREYRFMVSIDASLIDPSLKPPFDKRQVLMQGSVDLAYLRNDGSFVIADYKTDRISYVGELVTRYKTQLALYKNAFEQSSGRRVSKCILYSVYLNESIELDI